jgi:hypothetical protein
LHCLIGLFAGNELCPALLIKIDADSQTGASEGVEADPYRKFIIDKDIDALGIVILLANSSDGSDRHDGMSGMRFYLRRKGNDFLFCREMVRRRGTFAITGFHQFVAYQTSFGKLLRDDQV